MMIKAIIFDFDGTIIDSEQTRYSTYEKLFVQEFGVKIPRFDPNIIGRKQEITIKKLLDMFQLEANLVELIKKRDNARKEKDYKAADKIRKLLFERYGVILEDTEKGTVWKLAK